MTHRLVLGGRPRPMFVGVIHLLPLPGSPHPSPGLDGVVARAVGDARALAAGGADAVLVENFGDAPFVATSVSPYVVAAMTRIALAVREAVPDLPLGVNVLRNDARAALSVAAAVGAGFIRVNVHVGSAWTDQGLIEGRARETLLERNRLGAQVDVLADVDVKHAAPVAARALVDVARDTWFRGGASALIITGSGTGQPLRLEDLRMLREALPGVPLLAGSGVSPASPESLRGLIDGAIVGTYLHEDGDLSRSVDLARVRAVRSWLEGSAPPPGDADPDEPR